MCKSKYKFSNYAFKNSEKRDTILVLMRQIRFGDNKMDYILLH